MPDIKQQIKSPYERGLACYNMRNYAGAIEHLTKVIDLTSNTNHLALSYRGMSYLRSNKPFLALKDFRKTAELLPTSIPVLYNLALAYRTSTQYNKANQCYAKILILQGKQKKPRNPYFYSERGDNAFLQGEYPQAISDYKSSLSFDETPRLYHKLAEVYQKMGNIPYAIDNYTNAINLTRCFPHEKLIYSLNNRAVCHVLSGNVHLALADFDNALDICPHFSLAKENKKTLLNTVQLIANSVLLSMTPSKKPALKHIQPTATDLSKMPRLICREKTDLKELVNNKPVKRCTSAPCKKSQLTYRKDM